MTSCKKEGGGWFKFIISNSKKNDKLLRGRGGHSGLSGPLGDT